MVEVLKYDNIDNLIRLTWLEHHTTYNYLELGAPLHSSVSDQGCRSISQKTTTTLLLFIIIIARCELPFMVWLIFALAMKKCVTSCRCEQAKEGYESTMITALRSPSKTAEQLISKSHRKKKLPTFQISMRQRCCRSKYPNNKNQQ